jgi:L-fuconolactonase
MVAAMDKVGVDGAIFVSPFSMYRYDASYAVEVQKAHPGRFALVKPVDPDDPAVADVIADWKKTPGTVGIRIFMTKETNRAPGDPGLERICRAAVKHNFPINLIFSGNLDAGTALIDRYPDTSFVIDHMALQQPSVPPAPPEPWADLPKVVDLAKRKNAVMQDQWRLHAGQAALPFPGHLGPAGSPLRGLGFRAVPVGHGLDARVRGRQLRAGGRALP